MQYRRYLPEDFSALYRLEEQCFSPRERFPRTMMRRLVATPSTATWMAFSAAGSQSGEKNLAGFAIVEWSRSEAAYLHTLEVAPEHRRAGVGRELLRSCIASARAAEVRLFWLHVAEENLAARALYRSLGFVEQEREEHYYGRGRHALVCACRLG